MGRAAEPGPSAWTQRLGLWSLGSRGYKVLLYSLGFGVMIVTVNVYLENVQCQVL